MMSSVKKLIDPDVSLLQAAADPTRLAILRQLSADGATCACDLTGCCGVSQPTISHHLKVLRQAGWVSSERRGTWIWYAIRPEAVERFRTIAGGIQAGDARTVGTLAAPGRLTVIQPA